MPISNGAPSLPGSTRREFAAWETSIRDRFNQRWDPKLEKLMVKFNKSIAEITGDAAKVSIKQKKFEEGELKNYQRKREAAWSKLQKEISRMHVRVQLDFETVIKLQEKLSENAVDPIPYGGRWITFPIRAGDDPESANGEKVTITWTDATVREATYYKTTCWFGQMVYDKVPIEISPGIDVDSDVGWHSDDLDEALGSTAKKYKVETKEIPKVVNAARLELFGETDLFIAADFIEERYRGAPHLRGVHIRDRFPSETDWAYLCLDNFFHYGQDSSNSPKYRFLVYHPFVRTRNVPQRAFAENLRIKTAKAFADGAAASGSDYLAAAGQLANMVVDTLYDWRADPLKRFGDSNIYSLSPQVEGLEKELRRQNADVNEDIKEIVGGLELQSEVQAILNLAKDSSSDSPRDVATPEDKLKRAVLRLTSGPPTKKNLLEPLSNQYMTNQTFARPKVPQDGMSSTFVRPMITAPLVNNPKSSKTPTATIQDKLIEAKAKAMGLRNAGSESARDTRGV